MNAGSTPAGPITGASPVQPVKISGAGNTRPPRDVIGGNQRCRKGKAVRHGGYAVKTESIGAGEGMTPAYLPEIPGQRRTLVLSPGPCLDTRQATAPVRYIAGIALYETTKKLYRPIST